MCSGGLDQTETAAGLNRSPFEQKGKKMESLIKAIMQLYMEISSRLFQLRVENFRTRTGPGPDIDLAGPLIDRLSEYVAESANRIGEAASAATEQAPPHQASSGENRPNSSSTPSPRVTPPLAPGKRGPSLFHDAGVLSSQPSVGEQLKKQTFRYISQAVDCARQGKVEAAEVCAEHAESAFKLAAQYLSEDEYRSFAEQVLSRLKRPPG
jgi:hypothetical protein